VTSPAYSDRSPFFLFLRCEEIQQSIIDNSELYPENINVTRRRTIKMLHEERDVVNKYHINV
jgi:hypothetical protein